MTRSKAVETTADAAPAEVRPYEKMVAELQGIAKLENMSGASFDIATQVVDKIASAQTLDDIFDAANSGLISLKDTTELHNVPVEVTEVAWRKSSEAFQENSLGVYAIIDLTTLHDGESWKISTGAPNIVASLRQMEKLTGFPVKLRFATKMTGSGQTLLTIARP